LGQNLARKSKTKTLLGTVRSTTAIGKKENVKSTAAIGKRIM
jgi:hypothetical protein